MWSVGGLGLAALAVHLISTGMLARAEEVKRLREDEARVSKD